MIYSNLVTEIWKIDLKLMAIRPPPPKKNFVALNNKKIFWSCLLTLLCNRIPLIEHGVVLGLREMETVSRNGGCLQVILTKHFLRVHKKFWGLGKVFRIPTLKKSTCHKIFRGAPAFNTLRTGLLNCLNARSRGLTFRHRASCIEGQAFR